MGPVAHEALPKLKRWAKDGGTDAARAVKYLELGKTKLELDDEADNTYQARTVNREKAFPTKKFFFFV
jgi:hypothetical protein